ncbi:MAG: sodium/proline symporter [Verrucomicrobiota bacterium]|nr:sodium/proline symporter [Verrucomicrobiota bacterium]
MFSQISAIVLYFSILVTIGLLSRKRKTTDKDFNLGNRKLNFWVTGISAHADDMSSWLFIAYPMAIFVAGIGKAWIAIGLVLGMFLNWQIIAPRLRRATEKYDSYTLSTFFERRFGDSSGLIRIMSAVMILFFMTYYISGGLVSTGRLFESLFHIDYYIGITVASLIMISYMFIGGFISVAWTDFTQGLFLLVTLVIVPIVAFFQIESVSQITAIAHTKSISLELIPDYSFLTFFSILSLTVGWGLGYFGQPHILTKFMAIKNADDLKKSKYLGMTWQIIVLSAATAVALIGLAFFPDGLAKPEMIFVEMTRSVFFPFAAFFTICGIFAANISTMDSQILVCATVLSEDFYKRIINKNATSKQLLWASRLGVLFFAGLAFCMAYGQSATIMSIVEYSWSGLGSSFGPLLLVALYTKSANAYGAIAGITTGGLTVALWPLINPLLTSVPIVPLFPAFFLSLLAIFTVSWLTRTATEQAYTT